MRRYTPEAGTFRFPICGIGEIDLHLESYSLEEPWDRLTSIILTMPLLIEEGTYLKETMHFKHCGHSLRHDFQKAKSFEPPEEVSVEKVVNCATFLEVSDSRFRMTALEQMANPVYTRVPNRAKWIRV